MTKGSVLPNFRSVLVGGAAYYRVSSKEQEREGFSIDAQRRLIRDYAERKGINIVREFVDVETAKTTGRPQFGEMLKFIKKNKAVKALLVEKHDRLHRNFADLVKVDELEVEVHLVKDGDVMTKDARASDKFMYGIKTLMAKQYCDNLSEEARKGMLEKAEQGLWPSAAPFGFKNALGPDGKKIIVRDPEAAKVVQQIFEWYSSGDVAVLDIVERARTAGMTLSKRGGGVNASKVHQILRRRLYSGQFEWKGRVYRGSHEALISPELWQAVQDRLDGRKAKRHRRSRHEFAYARLMSCGRCGPSIVGEIKKGKYVYYHCTEHKGTCSDPYTREADLDEQFAAVLESLRFDEEVLGWIRAAFGREPPRHQPASRGGHPAPGGPAQAPAAPHRRGLHRQDRRQRAGRVLRDEGGRMARRAGAVPPLDRQPPERQRHLHARWHPAAGAGRQRREAVPEAVRRREAQAARIHRLELHARRRQD